MNMLLFLFFLSYTPTCGQDWGTRDFFHYHHSYTDYDINNDKYSARVLKCADGKPSMCKIKLSKNGETLMETLKNEDYIRFQRGCPPAECDNDQKRFVLHPVQKCPVCLGPDYYTQQMCLTMADCAPLATACLNGVCRFPMPTNSESPFTYRTYCQYRTDCPPFFDCLEKECVTDDKSVFHIQNYFCAPPRWTCPTNFECNIQSWACFAQKLCTGDNQCDTDQTCDPRNKICVPASINNLQTSKPYPIAVSVNNVAIQRPVIASEGKKQCSCKMCSRVCNRVKA